MKEQLPAAYRPYTPIRSNRRYAIAQGYSGDQKVCVKSVVAPELKERLRAEARGIEAFRNLDSKSELYRLPSVVAVHDDCVVTSWVDGMPMAEDFRAGRLEAVDLDLIFLTKLYAYIDSNTAASGVVGRAAEPVVRKHLQKLKDLQYERCLDVDLVASVATFILQSSDAIETRPTNGDLQPGNILMSPGLAPALIDFETYRDNWPRHYNTVNFICNYQAAYPKLSDRLRDMLRQYMVVADLSLDSSRETLNYSAAIRSLQLAEERLMVGDLDAHTVAYIESMMRTIVSGQLFIDQS